MDAETRSYLELALVQGVGPILLYKLMHHFGSARAALQATSEQYREIDGVGERLVAMIRQRDRRLVDQMLNACEKNQIGYLIATESRYPVLLRSIPDPPSILFYKGTFSEKDQLSIAIVGTRHATAYGKDHAGRISRSLSRAGFTLVSGLARGIDAVVHEAALRTNGRTIAVLANGLDTVYPPENNALAEEILEQGGMLLSEQPPGFPPKRGMFPQRNRIISGISLGVLVIEAAQRSGTLITARHAAEQGRDVFALPGPVNSRVSQGCHQLIRDGATLASSAEDIIESLGPMVQDAKISPEQTVRRPAELHLNQQEQAVLNAIGFESTDIDCIIVRSELPVARVLSTLSVLESKRFVRRAGGRSFVRS